MIHLHWKRRHRLNYIFKEDFCVLHRAGFLKYGSYNVVYNCTFFLVKSETFWTSVPSTADTNYYLGCY